MQSKTSKDDLRDDIQKFKKYKNTVDAILLMKKLLYYLTPT